MAVLSENEFTELLEEHEDLFRGHAAKRTWNPSDADDVYADAVETAWKQRQKFEPGTNFRNWVLRILTNKSYVHNRVTKRYSIPLPETTKKAAAKTTHPSVLENSQVFLQSVSDEVMQALKSMRPVERRCLLRRAMHGYSYREIARDLNIPLGTVMTHLARGRARARRTIEEFGTNAMQERLEKVSCN